MGVNSNTQLNVDNQTVDDDEEDLPEEVPSTENETTEEENS